MSFSGGVAMTYDAFSYSGSSSGKVGCLIVAGALALPPWLKLEALDT